MNPIIDKIRDEVRHLPFGERVRLVKELEDDLDTDEPSVIAEIEASWDVEEQNRVEEIIDGSTKLMTQADLDRRLDEVRAKYSA